MAMTNQKPVALVVGASRGIGRQVAIDFAANGYAVVVAAKSHSNDSDQTAPFPPDPTSNASTISTVEREIRSAGGDATAIPVDVTDLHSVERLVAQTVEKYRSLDVLVYNPGAIWWASVDDTPTKRYQLMQRVNAEGLYGTVQAALPHLKRSRKGGRIIVVSPPIYSRFFRGKTAYAMTKVAMSVLTKGLAMDFQRQGLNHMAISSIWPAVVKPPFPPFPQTTNLSPRPSPSNLPPPPNSHAKTPPSPTTSEPPQSFQMPSSPCSGPRHPT